MPVFDSTKPIYRQVAEWIENDIMHGHFFPGEKVYSQYQLADQWTINPATAAKGLNVLADEGILYKRRGLGMFVAEGAVERIREKRKSTSLALLVRQITREAVSLDVTEEHLIDIIRSGYAEAKEESTHE